MQVTVELIIWCIAVGAVWAIWCAYYNRTILGGFVRVLINSGALTPDSAMTLAEAGYQKNVFVKRALFGANMFRKMVFEVDDEIITGAEGHSFSARTKPLDLSTARFYVAQENRIMAEMRYNNKGADIFGSIVSSILILVLAYVVTILLPIILDLF